jgi:hypothetical protein
MQDFCELCGRGGLALAYAPEHLHRGIRVYVCCSCRLVQFLPRIDHEPCVARREEAHVAERYGVPLSGPEALAAAKPGVVAVLTRGAKNEIATDVIANKLLSRARLRRAA